jgi:WD40 repeat protein
MEKEAAFYSGQSVKTISISPDSKWIAVGAEVWDIAQSHLKARAPGYPSSADVAQFSPDGQYLAMGGEESTMIWNLREDRKQFELDDSWTVEVAYSANGATLATAGERGLRFWNAETGKTIQSIRAPREISSMAYSPDGKFFATGDYSGTVTVWEVGTGTKRWANRIGTPWSVRLFSGVSGLFALAFSLALFLVWRHSRNSSAASSPAN